MPELSFAASIAEMIAALATLGVAYLVYRQSRKK